MSNTKSYAITHAERLELLEAFNNLNHAMSYLLECHDMNISDVRNLEKLEDLLRKTFNFKSNTDRAYWTTYDLGENVKRNKEKENE